MKSYKLYTCGTIPWEIHASNAGPLEFYCSANALRDDKSCVESCGILEFEVKLRRTVRRSKRESGKSSAEVRFEEQITIPLSKKLIKIALDDAGRFDLAASAVTRALAHFKVQARKKRRAVRGK